MDGTGSIGKARKALFDEGIQWVELKLEANSLGAGVCVCACVSACVYADLGLASSAVIWEGKTTA